MSQVPPNLDELLGDSEAAQDPPDPAQTPAQLDNVDPQSVPGPDSTQLQPPTPWPKALITIYEQQNPDERIYFPITPSQVPETMQADPKSFKVIGAGNFSFPDGISERKYQLQGYFPGVDRYDPSVPEGHGNNPPHIHVWRPPEEITAKLHWWLEVKMRLRFRSDSKAGTLDTPVYLNTYTFTRQGPAGDVGYQVEFVEWRSIMVITDNGGSSTTGSSGPGGDSPSNNGSDEPTEGVPTDYTVVPGDSLSLISKRYLGDAGRWREIYDLNHDVIGDDPHWIYPGQVLKIPGGTVADQDNSGYASSGSEANEGV